MDAETADCATGTTGRTPLTAAAAAALTTAQAQAATAVQATAQLAAQRKADLTAVAQFAAANPAQPIWQALARLLAAL